MSRPTPIALVLLLALVPAAPGHHNPDEIIAALTAEIARDGGGSGQFYRRATEYRQLRRDGEAEADFRKAAALDSGNPEPYKALAQILLWQAKLRPARVEARHAIERAVDPRLRAACRVLLAQIEQAEGHGEAGLAACEAAFADYPEGEIDWYLLRAELQEGLGEVGSRIEGLRTGHERTGSIVLRNAWIDAQLDAGLAASVLPLIERELAACRLKSSWLLRRARARLLLDEPEGARADLDQAVAEIDSRMVPARPHSALLIDRATALALLGRTAEARRDYLSAEALDADPWLLRKAGVLIGGAQ